MKCSGSANSSWRQREFNCNKTDYYHHVFFISCPERTTRSNHIFTVTSTSFLQSSQHSYFHFRLSIKCLKSAVHGCRTNPVPPVQPSHCPTHETRQRLRLCPRINHKNRATLLSSDLHVISAISLPNSSFSVHVFYTASQKTALPG